MGDYVLNPGGIPVIADYYQSGIGVLEKMALTADRYAPVELPKFTELDAAGILVGTGILAGAYIISRFMGNEHKPE